MELTKRHGVYWIRIRRGGVQYYQSTHANTKREAEKNAKVLIMAFNKEKQTRSLSNQLCKYAIALAREELSKVDLSKPLDVVEKQAYNMALDAIEKIFPRPVMTAKELWQCYMEHTHSSQIKKSTLATKKQRFDKFISYARETDMNSINEGYCKTFLDSMEDISAQTRKNYVSDLSSVFEACGLNNPWTAKLRESSSSIEHKERTPISLEDARKVIQYCEDNPNKTSKAIRYSLWADFLRALYYTGLRPVDVCHLRHNEIKDGMIELIPEKTSRTRRKVSYVADKKLLAILKKHENNGSDYFFPEFAESYDRGRANIDYGFRMIIHNIGLSGKITLYGFRHFFVTYQMDSGISDEDVASAVGHTSTKTTMEHYYHNRKKVSLNEMPVL